MTAIAALTEDFTGASPGTAVTAANTIFANVFGSGSSKFVADPFLGGGNQMMQVIATGGVQDKYHALDFGATGVLWFNFDLDLGTSTVPANTAILQGFTDNTGATKIFDVRLLANTRTLQLRDEWRNAWTSAVLSANTKYRVFVHVKATTPRVLRVLIYNAGGTTLLHDSGEITGSAVVSTIATLRIGLLNSSTADMRFGRLRGDNADGPSVTPPATVSLVAGVTNPLPGQTVTLTANTTGGAGSVVFTQTVGPTVALTGTGNTRSFTAPAYWPLGGDAPASPTLTFKATYSGASDTVTVAPSVHTRWRKSADGSWKPVYTTRKT